MESRRYQAGFYAHLKSRQRRRQHTGAIHGANAQALGAVFTVATAAHYF